MKNGSYAFIRRGTLARSAPAGVKRDTTMSDENMRTEEHRVSGERLVARVKELIHQGNVRRVIVKNDDGETILEIPLTLGVVGADWRS